MKHPAGAGAILISLLACALLAQQSVRSPQPAQPTQTAQPTTRRQSPLPGGTVQPNTSPANCTGIVQDLTAAYVCDAVSSLEQGGSRQQRNAVSLELTSYCKSKGRIIIEKVVVCTENAKSCRCDAQDSCNDVQKFCKTYKQNDAGTKGLGSGCDVKALETVSGGHWALIH